MVASDFLSALINEIKQLYNQIVLAQLHIRMSRYHRSARHDSTSHAKDLKSSLLEYVDNVVVADEPEPEKPKLVHNYSQPVFAGMAGKHIAESRHTVYPFKDSKKSVGPNPYKLNKKQVGELTRYFKERKKGTDLHPGIKEKLKDSIWEHINASIQCAHKGEKRNAKMHVDIANYALKEISHYMPEDQYSALSKKIDDRLHALKSSDKTSRLH